MSFVGPRNQPATRSRTPAARVVRRRSARALAGLGGLRRGCLGDRLRDRCARLSRARRDGRARGHVRGPRRNAAGEPHRRGRHLHRRPGRPRLRAAVGTAASAPAGDHPGAHRIGIRSGARAHGVRDQAAARPRRRRAAVRRLGATGRNGTVPVGHAVLRALVPGTRRADDARRAAPPPPHRRLGSHGTAAGGSHRTGGPRPDSVLLRAGACAEPVSARRDGRYRSRSRSKRSSLITAPASRMIASA